METPKYQVGDMIYVSNVYTLNMNGPKLAEVIGYRLDGNITQLIYLEVGKNREELLPVIFEDVLTKSAGKNAKLVYGKES